MGTKKTRVSAIQRAETLAKFYNISILTEIEHEEYLNKEFKNDMESVAEKLAEFQSFNKRGYVFCLAMVKPEFEQWSDIPTIMQQCKSLAWFVTNQSEWLTKDITDNMKKDFTLKTFVKLTNNN
jgi:hypothetical protein